jgi:membrane peptidoglycan carboxypeptidase
LRLLGIVVAAALVMSGSITAISAVTSGLIHNSASAQELPLPPISSRLQEGSTVYADDGTTVLGVFKGAETRDPIALSQVSKTMITAVLDTEDHGFYQHGGFDVSSIVRAFVNDAQGNSLQGGSTIPQQLVKQVYLTPTRTLNRKIREAVLADRLEQKYSKDAILQAYLNTIYLGNGVYGVQAAAELYFNEPASQLNVPQSALLAGMISDPNGDDPYVNGPAARQRRAEVLGRMVVYRDITPAQETAANNTPLPIRSPVQQVATGGPQSWPLLAVQNYLLTQSNVLGTNYDQRYQALFNGGLKIYTTFDPILQAEAQQAVTADTPANTGGFVEGLVSIDPATGDVRALVGGPNPVPDHVEVMQGIRQPGSGFKLFTLVGALQQGYSVFDTVDANQPCAIIFPGNTSLVQNPIHNDTPSEGGTVSLVNATANSINCAYIRMAHEVGLPNVVAEAYKLGISPREVPAASADVEPAIVIGADAVQPIEMADAYASVAAQGVFHPYTFIDHIDDETGSQIYNGVQPGTVVFSPQVAAEADVAFQAVVQSGTGTAAALYNRPVAGKTGTTEHNVDAWFNGYTPQLETTVWMGNFQSETPIYIPKFGYVYGANFPAETWHTFMAAAMANDPVVGFPAVNYATIPPTKYVTSPSLVADDVTNHNGMGSGNYTGYSGGYSNYNSCSYGQLKDQYGNCYYPSATTSAYVSPTTPPSTSQATTPPAAPPTKPSPPPTTKPAPGPGPGAGGGGAG